MIILKIKKKMIDSHFYFEFLIKSFLHVIKRSIDDNVLETQKHSLQFEVKESVHLNCDMNLIDSNEYDCIEKEKAWDCSASCTANNQKQGIKRKVCRCYIDHPFIFIYE